MVGLQHARHGQVLCNSRPAAALLLLLLRDLLKWTGQDWPGLAI